MCGIHGFIRFNEGVSTPEKMLEKMVFSTQHRGPDYSGFWNNGKVFFGHNRLSIIDLHSESNQPMHFGDLSIVFNGEIYNYKEIREELKAKGCVFSTQSDTEVILQAYTVFGEKCVEKFIGMWAFAIYDAAQDLLFCSRDRFGIKPFYYISDSSGFYFASEIKSLKQTSVFKNSLNFNQISRGLQMGWAAHNSESYFEQIASLPPAHNLFIRNKKTEISRYWSYPNSRNNWSEEEAVGQFLKTFEDSLKLHVRSDVPLGATLSGGLDSSSIVSTLLKNQFPGILETFSIYYDNDKKFDERPFIQTIEKKYKNQFHLNYYSPTNSEIERDFHKIAETMDFPLSGSSPISQYYVMQLAKQQGMTVVLSGQGADDFLGGYGPAYYRQYADLLRHFKFGSLMREMKAYSEQQDFGFGKIANVLSKSILSSFLNENQLYRFEWSKYFPFLVDKQTNWSNLEFQGNSKLSDYNLMLMNYSSLPTLLHYEDRNSMAHSLESRVPFLDHRIVELAFSIPEKLMIHKGWSKYLLRKSMSNILPEAIQWRTDKKGFVTPGEVLWLRGNLSHLLEIDYQRLDFLDKNKTKKVIDEFKNGDNSKANLVWRVASLNYWMKHFV